MAQTGPPTPNVPKDLLDAYAAAGQEHVFRFWSELTEDERESFARELRSIHLAGLTSLHSSVSVQASVARARRSPAPVLRLDEKPAFTTRERATAEGKELLAAGKVGVFLVAGGQGSRLGFDGPKGCLPVGPLSGKTLFQLHAEKIAALGRDHGVHIPWYIMTSRANDAATRSFFTKHHHFGFRPDDVFFLPQSMLPALDDQGKLILEAKGRLFLSPNGHGGAYAAFRDGHCIEDAARRGLEHLFYFQVDNPLIRIADPLFLGLHALARSEMSLKVLRKTGPGEKIGVVALEDGKTKVVEYSDFSKEESERRDAKGELVYWAGSIAIHAFTLRFFKRVCDGDISLPYHLARKKVATLGTNGQPTEIDATKFETFVFDSLPQARTSLSVEVRREEEFAPIKNKSGVDSLDSGKDLLVSEHRRWLAAAGIDAKGKVEISPRAALGPEDLRERLVRDGTTVPDGDLLVERSEDGKVRARGTVPVRVYTARGH